MERRFYNKKRPTTWLPASFSVLPILQAYAIAENGFYEKLKTLFHRLPKEMCNFAPQIARCGQNKCRSQAFWRVFGRCNTVLWCNGSTRVFGSLSGGSNPPRTTEHHLEFLFLQGSLFCL